jgi:hypothetical protein
MAKIVTGSFHKKTIVKERLSSIIIKNDDEKMMMNQFTGHLI